MNRWSIFILAGSLPALVCGFGLGSRAQDEASRGALAVPVQGTTQQAVTVFEQNFGWDDPLGTGEYIWGQDGYLKMDGSVGKIQCSRRLKEAIKDSGSRVEIKAIFALGKMYRIVLYDSSDKMVVDGHIDRAGQVLFNNGNSLIDSTANIGADRGFWGQASAPHTLVFDQFDFRSKKFKFSLDGKSYSSVPLCSSSDNVSRLELQTDVLEPGTLIWLGHYKQTGDRDRLIDNQNFEDYWVSNPAVVPGYPSAKWQATTYRPKDFKWLEVSTRYGAVYVRFASKPIVRGKLDIEMMTDNVDHETQLNLGEYKYDPQGNPGNLPTDPTGVSTISGGWKINVGIFARLWTSYRDEVGNPHPSILEPLMTFKPFDNAPPAAINKPYRLKIEWNTTSLTYRVWIDEILQTYGGVADIPMLHRPEKGIDMIMIHPGDRNPWFGPYLHSYWGKVKVTAE